MGAILSAGQSNAGSASNPTVKLNKSILASSALAAAAAATDNSSVNVVNLVQGGGQSAGSSSSSALQGFSGSTAGQASADPDADDADVGRLQALLEARGIPPHVFGSLGEYSPSTELFILFLIPIQNLSLLFHRSPLSSCPIYSAPSTSSIASDHRREQHIKGSTSSAGLAIK